MSATLTIHDANRLKQLETTITKGSKVFIDVGLALAEIKASKLYRENYSTFEQYCAVKWSWSKQHVYRLIECAPVAKSNPRVTNYKQASKLAKVDPTKREKVLDAASEQAATEGRPMTSKDIADAATEQDPPVDIESTVMESQPATPTDTAPTPEPAPAPAPAPAEPRVWPEDEFKKTVSIILTEYQHEGGAVELTRSAQVLRDWAECIEDRAKWMTTQGVKK